jgi:hypothetical protein
MNDMGRPCVVAFLVVSLLLSSVSGCAGYRFASQYNHLPPEIQSVSIPFFKNDTFESNIEAFFTNALISEFIKNRQFTVLPQGGDATLYGVVKDYRAGTISYSREDRAMEYRAYVILELTLKRNDTGEVLWRNPNFVHDEEYRVVTDDIAFTDASKQNALQKIAAEVAVQIYEELVLGF